jgi:hypothetical protein
MIILSSVTGKWGSIKHLIWITCYLPNVFHIKTAVLEEPPDNRKNHKILAQEQPIFSDFLDQTLLR